MNAVLRTVSRVTPIMLLAAAILVYAGLGLSYVHGGTTAVANLLFAGALALAAVAAGSSLRNRAGAVCPRAIARRLAVVTGVATAVVALFQTNVLASRYEIRLDLTSAKTHTLKPQSMACLGRLKEKIDITALYAGTAPDYVKDLLEEFARESRGNVSQEIVDPLQHLGYAAQFGPRIDGSERRIVLRTAATDTRPARREEINCKENPLTEDRLTSAIVKLTGGPKKVYFTTGHQEYDIENTKDGGYSDLKAALKKQGIAAERLMLASVPQVPSDCNVLVVGGARREFSKEEKERLVAFTNRGGHVLLLLESAFRLEPGQKAQGNENPSFNDILADWGLAAGDDVVVDLANHIGQDVGCPAVSTYPQHDKIVSNLGISFFIRPRSLTFTERAKGQVLVAPLVETMNGTTSWAETDRGLFVRYDKDKDLAGPVKIAAVLLRPPEKGPASRAASKMIVIGNSSFVTNEFGSRYSNIDLVVNSIAWLAETEPLLGSQISNEPPKLQVTSKDLQRAQVLLGMMPLAVMSLGIIVWWRRYRSTGGESPAR